jgi:hypothetical protein
MRWVLCVMSLGMAAAADAAESKSAPLARELTGVLQQRQQDACAVADPADGQRFVAAMLFPGQLLVIGARYPLAGQLQPLLESKSYREIYAALHSAADRSGRLFVHDMGGDGIRAQPEGATDIIYEDGQQQTVFDGHPERRDLSSAAYKAKFQHADEEYSRMLELLVAHARGNQ